MGAVMYRHIYTILVAGGLSMVGVAAPTAAAERSPFVSVGEVSRSPIGWVEFCIENARDCAPDREATNDATVTARSWRELVRINKLVNDSVKPMTDLEH